jgi:hypothetical protein
MLVQAVCPAALGEGLNFKLAGGQRRWCVRRSLSLAGPILIVR